METEPSDLMAAEEALVLKSSFVDYTRFEGDGSLRAETQKKFITDQIWLPKYDYPRLRSLHDSAGTGKNAVDQKTELQNAVFALELARQRGEIEEAKAELFARFHETRLKRIMLTETAKAMQTAGDGEARSVLRNSFMELNRELYGEMNEPAWLGIITTEKRRAANFAPASAQAQSIKEDLDRVLMPYEQEEEEPELLDQEMVHEFRPLILARYAAVFKVIPDTADDVMYDAKQCRDIMQQALEAGGFDGWKVAVDPQKSNPATNVNKRTIILPASTLRTADELKRLIMHEQEVHARRGHNAERFPTLPLLKNGTADYADVEEGLGVFFEMILAGKADNPAVHRARDRYITAGLALGLGGRPARDARQTYEVVWRTIALRGAKEGVVTAEDVLRAKKSAYSHIDNAYRGTDFAAKGVIYTKLKVYYEGLMKNVSYMQRIGMDEAKFNEMFIGKYNHTDEAERKLVLESIKSNP